MSQRIPILVIDDDAEFLELVEFNLELAGFDISLATSGREGLKLAGKQPQPAVILLDMTMPEMNGLEVLSELKYNSETKNIPVFMLTAKTMPSDIEKAFEAGVDDYITKPVELMKLGNLVKSKLAKLCRGGV